MPSLARRMLVVAVAAGVVAPGCAHRSGVAGPEPGVSRYSQHAEEWLIRRFFGDRRGGIFLDVGCSAPIAYSNTYYLETRLDWSGIAVDALGEFAEAWRTLRPRSRFFAYLVTDHSGGIEPFYRSELTGISSTSRERVEGRVDEGEVVPYRELRVPTITLSDLLDASHVDRIDLLSMDIEGGELRALAGFDIERFRPQLVCVEAKPPLRAGLVGYFARHGYRRIEPYEALDPDNYYFTPRR